MNIQNPEVINDIIKYPAIKAIFDGKDGKKSWEYVELNLLEQSASEVPIAPTLEYFHNCVILQLNFNNIARFNATRIIRGIPNVLHIDLSHNKIKVFNDLQDLGKLKKLCVLNFQYNPILGDEHCCLPHLSVVKNLMFSDRYTEYQPVKVLCAAYSVQTKSQNMTYNEHQRTLAEERHFHLQKLRDNNNLHNWDLKQKSKIDYHNQDQKYDLHYIKKCTMRCPVPRKMKYFAYLQVVNNQIITQQNIINLTGIKNVNDIRFKWEKIKDGAKKKYIKRWNLGKDFKEVNQISDMVKQIGNEHIQKERDILQQKNKKRRLSKKKGVKVGIELWAEKRKKAQKFRKEKESKEAPKFKKD